MNSEILGLTKTEERVYLRLLGEGNTLASSLIRKLQLHRATVYDVLNRLIEKGLASFTVVDKKKYYEASSPNRILDIIKEKKKNIEEQEKEAEKLVKELSKIKEKTPSSDIRILEGKEGLKLLMQELLNIKEFLVLGGEIRFGEYLSIYTKHWAEERERKKIYARILSNVINKTEWKYNQHKKLPKGLNFPSSTLIFGDQIAIVLPEEPIRIILINSKQTAISYKSEFEMLWKK